VPESVNLGQLTAQEWEHLHEQVDRLEQALTEVDSADLSRFLPPPGTPQRLIFLHELIKTEMEIRCRRSKTISLDEYLQRYPELGSADTLPADLIYEEFRVRHRYGDRPALDLYQQRFPAQFEQLKKLEKKDPVATVFNTALPNTAPLPPERRGEPKSKTAPAVNETLPPETLPHAPPVPPQLPPRPSRPPSKGAGSNPTHVLPPSAGYQTLERIGKGQFGEVYRGLSSGGVVVAIKKILRSIDDESSQRELKALERLRELRHPFLLQTHDFYPFEDRLIIVMELADGSLHERFKECIAAGKPGVPADELLEYFREAAEALDYLREQKLAHRDIKPQNLLHLKGHAKVADFGVARSQENTVDHTMNVGGTPAYMPPEMWRGDISVHSDQYSFAITWYEMRTGRRVFTGKTPIEIAQQHLTGAPDVSGVPAAEQKVLLRALAKRPEQRYPNCKEFVQDLAAAIRPKAPPPPATSRRRTMMLLTVALTVTASILLALLCKNLLSTRVDWPPTGWKPLGQEVEKDFDGGTYYRRLVKKVGNEDVVMVLVKKEKATDPKTFYMMENKVWNKLFQEFAADPNASADLQRYGQENPGTVKEEWRKGGWAPEADPKMFRNPKDLGVDGSQERVPVLRVTVTEAYFFAQWLGGKLPTQRQWFKAAGASLDTTMSDEENTGPFEGLAGDRTGLGVDLLTTGPLPVGTAPRAVSRAGCRDMAGNGFEWLRDVQRPVGEVVPVDIAVRDQANVLILGQDYLEPGPLTFKLMRKPRVKNYFDAPEDTSFRVVLERE
jgi:serine/threonine protein kinase